MRPLMLPVLAMLAAVTATRPIDPAGRRIVGEWRGTSLCTNRTLAPACKDETVRYTFTGPLGGTNTYHVVADKLVGREYQPMGEMDFTYGSTDSTWTNVFDSRNCKQCKWWFRLRASGLIGGLTTGEGDTLRKAGRVRHKP